MEACSSTLRKEDVGEYDVGSVNNVSVVRSMMLEWRRLVTRRWKREQCEGGGMDDAGMVDAGSVTLEA